jgi:hypothetical protein
MILLFMYFIGWLTPTEYRPTQVNPTIQEGKSIMEAKCIKCHAFKPVENYTLEKWNRTLPRMTKKAKLGLEDQNKMMAYIRSVIEK